MYMHIPCEIKFQKYAESPSKYTYIFICARISVHFFKAKKQYLLCPDAVLKVSCLKPFLLSRSAAESMLDLWSRVCPTQMSFCQRSLVKLVFLYAKARSGHLQMQQISVLWATFKFIKVDFKPKVVLWANWESAPT